MDQRAVWDKSTGTLEEYTRTTNYNESLGLVIEETVTKGGPGIVDRLSGNAVAVAGLVFAVLALLIVLVKK